MSFAHASFLHRSTALRVLLTALAVSTSVAAQAAEYVIHISVDGLNSGVLQSLVDAGEAPNFKRFED